MFQKIDQVDVILDPYKEVIGNDFEGYKNHVYRVLYCYFQLNPSISANDKEKAIIASCFHDLGLWTKQTVAYLEPSIDLAVAYIKDKLQDDYIPEVTLLISEHHKLSTYTGEYANNVELFRRADLADFSYGLALGKIPRSFYKELLKAFPDKGFHWMLFKGALAWFSKHPLTMPPFMKR
jgi:hypothetical protein